MHSIAANLVFAHDNNFYKCLGSPYVYSPTLESQLKALNPIHTMGGSFFIKNALSVVSDTNKIWNCYLCDEGSGYALYSVASFSD
jgi:hypothetical protein